MRRMAADSFMVTSNNVGIGIGIGIMYRYRYDVSVVYLQQDTILYYGTVPMPTHQLIGIHFKLQYRTVCQSSSVRTTRCTYVWLSRVSRSSVVLLILPESK